MNEREKRLIGQDTPPPGMGLAVAALVLGGISIASAMFWYLAMIFGPLAIALSVAHKKLRGRMHGLATAGMITGIAGTVLGILFWLLDIVARQLGDSFFAWLETLFSQLQLPL